ncbi:hypothetical protein LCGC14_2635240 [marine sediment metagenome]|uniref:Uncharacterized protein n=1 Tax=marine sediment metagenome TaxID=412755 RepID=A0A0F9C9Z4_9ZZZZ
MTGLALQTTSHHRQYRSRTELEIDRKDLGEQLQREEFRRRTIEEQLKREMEASIRLGVEVLELKREVRSLESQLLWAQRKLGHRV